MSSLLISTIIPAYNAAAFVREAVDSALAQEGVEQEIIVIDDGSTDATPQILADYGDRIRVITQENRGIAAARNAGAAAARGRWLAFLDSDDIWLPRKLAGQSAQFRDGIDVIWSQRENFGAIGRVGMQPPPPPEELASDPFRTLATGNRVTTSSAVIRKSAFDRCHGFDESRDLMGCEDWDLWVRVAAGGGRFVFVPETLVRYRWHNTSISTRADHNCRARLRVIERAIAAGPPLDDSARREAFANAWETSAWYTAPTSRWTAAWWYLRAASYQPTRVSAYKSALKCLLGRA